MPRHDPPLNLALPCLVDLKRLGGAFPYPWSVLIGAGKGLL
jgi:hypothetical protein